MDGKNLMLEEGFIQNSFLKNMVSLASQLNEFEWAEKIANKYQPFIEKTYRKSAQHFNLGVINFYQSNYNKATSNLIKAVLVSTGDIYYDIDVKMLLLKTAAISKSWIVVTKASCAIAVLRKRH